MVTLIRTWKRIITSPPPPNNKSSETKKTATTTAPTAQNDSAAPVYRESTEEGGGNGATAEIKNTSNASTHDRTSTTKRSPDEHHDNPSALIEGRKRGSSLEGDLPRKKVAKKKRRYGCSAEGCTNQVVNGGV
eukprot:scaffold22062_cov47-Skeletonema_dohrnii-CCMP3373.AAC.1